MFKREKRSSDNRKVNRRTDSDGFYENKSDRHFRDRRCVKKVNNVNVVSRHPNYIVGETNTNYYSFGFTHKDVKGKKHKNHLLDSNPNKNDKSDSYIRKQMESANKDQYSDYIIKNMKLSKKDDDYVTSLIEKRKQKKK